MCYICWWLSEGCETSKLPVWLNGMHPLNHWSESVITLCSCAIWWWLLLVLCGVAVQWHYGGDCHVGSCVTWTLPAYLCQPLYVLRFYYFGNSQPAPWTATCTVWRYQILYNTIWPDNEHNSPRNMYRIIINLLINKDFCGILVSC